MRNEAIARKGVGLKEFFMMFWSSDIPNPKKQKELPLEKWKELEATLQKVTEEAERVTKGEPILLKDVQSQEAKGKPRMNRGTNASRKSAEVNNVKEVTNSKGNAIKNITSHEEEHELGK